MELINRKTAPGETDPQASAAHVKETATSMRTPGMAVFKQENVEDFYDLGEELGRWGIPQSCVKRKIFPPCSLNVTLYCVCVVEVSAGCVAQCMKVCTQLACLNLSWGVSLWLTGLEFTTWDKDWHANTIRQTGCVWDNSLLLLLLLSELISGYNTYKYFWSKPTYLLGKWI